MFDHRKVITLGIMGAGLLLTFAQQYGLSVVFYGIAIVFWLATKRSDRRAAPVEDTNGDTVKVTADSVQPSDGVQGAFARLNPAWRRWLGQERQ